MLLFLFSQAIQYYLDPVVVVGAPIDSVPYVVETYGEEEMKNAQDVGEYLRENTATPFSFYGYPGSISLPVLDGVSSTHTQVMLNGIPINDPFNGGFDLSLLPVSSTGKLEVVRGAFSSFGGASGMGGVVNVVLRKREGVEANTLLGGKGGIHTKHLSLRSGWKVKEIFLGMDGSAVIDSGYRTNTGMKGLGVHGVLEFSPVEMHVLYSYKRNGCPGPLPLDTTLGDATSPNDWMKSSFFSWDAVVRKGVVFIHPYAVRSYLFYHGDWLEEEYTSTRLGIKGGMRIENLKIFGEASVDTVESTVYSGMEKKTGVSLEYSKLFAPGLLIFNGRYAYSSLHHGNYSFTCGFVFYPVEGLKVGISCGRGYRNPTLLELYYPGFGNPELEPEEAWFYSVTLEKWGISLSFVETHAQRLITYGADWRPYNTDSARIRSFYADARRNFGPFGFGASLRFSHKKDVFPGLEYSIFLKGKKNQFEGGISLRGAAERSELEPYKVVDAWMSASWKMLGVLLRVENVLGEEYTEFPGYGWDRGYPAPPGPRFYVGIEVKK